MKNSVTSDVIYYGKRVPLVGEIASIYYSILLILATVYILTLLERQI
jgi:hypothetical protein